MNIGIDVRCLMEPRYSGVGEYTANLLNNLFEINKQNNYLLFYNAHGNYDKNLPKFNYPSVHYKKFNYPNKLLNASLAFLKRPKVDQMLGGVDLFFAPHVSFLALSASCKKVLTVHDLSFIKFPEFFSGKQKLWYKLFGGECSPLNFDLILADSHNTKRDLVELYNISEQKIKTIYLGVEQNYRPIDDPAELNKVKEKYNLPEKFILYLGTIEPRKNLVTLIRAYEQLNTPDYELVIAGNSGWGNKDIYKAAKNSKAAKKIRFIGYVDQQDKLALYNLASLFIYISYYEGFGFPPLEAMACGIPVVASYTSSLGEVLEDAAALVNPYNASEIKNAVDNILLNNDLALRMGQLGQNQAKKFSWQKTAEQTLNAFNSL